jgi:hypothetical protein
MRVRDPLAWTMLVILAAASLGAQTTTKVYGGATPQEVVTGLQKAVKSGDVSSAFGYISPAGRTRLADEAVVGVVMVLQFSDPSDPMPGSKPLPKAELDAKIKQYRAAVDLAKATLKPYGLDVIVGKPPLSPETKKVMDANLPKADTVALMTNLLATMEKIGPMVGMKKTERPPLPFEVGTVTDYKISGDKATAKATNETLEFVRIDGRWYLNPPAPKGGK